MSIRVDAAVRRHSWIALDPHLTLDGSLAYPPWPEPQAIRFKRDLGAPICSIDIMLDKREL